MHLPLINIDFGVDVHREIYCNSHLILFCVCLHSWEEKLPLVCGGLEKAWLFHEIGRCYLELKRYGEARDYGSRSLTAADDINDEKWQLNASVLMAQAECESKLHCPESPRKLNRLSDHE